MTTIPPVKELKKFQEGPGPVKGKTVTEMQALRYLRAVMTKFKAWNDPDRDWFSNNPPLSGDMPYVHWDWNGDHHPAIVWEGNSPYEWAVYPLGDDFRDEEFGFRVAGVPVPAEVHVEAAMSFVLTLYPDH